MRFQRCLLELEGKLDCLDGGHTPRGHTHRHHNTCTRHVHRSFIGQQFRSSQSVFIRRFRALTRYWFSGKAFRFNKIATDISTLQVHEHPEVSVAHSASFLWFGVPTTYTVLDEAPSIQPRLKGTGATRLPDDHNRNQGERVVLCSSGSMERTHLSGGVCCTPLHQSQFA